MLFFLAFCNCEDLQATTRFLTVYINMSVSSEIVAKMSFSKAPLTLFQFWLITINLSINKTTLVCACISTVPFKAKIIEMPFLGQ